MMRLPRFRYRAPRTIEEAAACLAENPAETMLLGGGTDLLPNMKRRHQTPSTLVALRGIRELAAIRDDQRPGTGDQGPRASGLHVGAGVTLSRLVSDPRIRESYRGLWQAAAQVATPHLRNMGTIGGNLCLDTRCTYYNQNYEWRKSIGFCLKRDGETCWVATSSPKCLAVSSTDSAPMLQALDASVTLVSSRGSRVLPVADLYANDGIHYLARRPDEILTTIALPSASGWRSAYWKLRRRGAFDFPVAAAAVAARLDGSRVVEARIVLGAVSSKPLQADRAASLLAGAELTEDAIAAAAIAAAELAKPMDNTDFELVWRKKMVRSLVADALREVRGDDMRARRHQLARQERLSLSPDDR
jgi:4-hydroxybenzoyl-CoA reductase subunit beta